MGSEVIEASRERDEWKKKFDHAEAERLYFKAESERYQRESLDHFNELQKVGRELSIDRDECKRKAGHWYEVAMTAGLFQERMRKALEKISEHGGPITASQIIAREALVLKLTQAEKIVAAMEKVCHAAHMLSGVAVTLSFPSEAKWFHALAASSRALNAARKGD